MKSIVVMFILWVRQLQEDIQVKISPPSFQHKIFHSIQEKQQLGWRKLYRLHHQLKNGKYLKSKTISREVFRPTSRTCNEMY